MMGNQMRPGDTEAAEVAGPGGGAPPTVPTSQKGIFDHLAEYLLQKPVAAPEASPPPRNAPAPPTLEEQGRVHEPTMFGGGMLDTPPLEPASSAGSAEPAAEKQAFVPEDAAFDPLIRKHAEESEDRERRAGHEAERLPVNEAKQVLRPIPPVQAATSARPAPPVYAGTGQVAGNSAASRTWWVWFSIILLAAMLIAFAVGQLLGSAS